MEISFKKYDNLIKEDLFLLPYGVHGISHARRVLYLACNLAKYYKLTEREWHMLAIACCYHDIGRTNDLYDELHGLKSVRKLTKLGLDTEACLTDMEAHVVNILIVYHALPDEYYPFKKNERWQLLYQILKDADGLDRMRFGDLDTKYLRLDQSKELVDFELRLLRADGVI